MIGIAGWRAARALLDGSGHRQDRAGGFDVVDFTNLQRQVTFGTSDVGKPKTRSGQGAPEQLESRRRASSPTKRSSPARMPWSYSKIMM